MVCVLFLSSCALFEKKEGERVPAEENGSQGDVDQLMKDRAELRAEIDTLKSELTSLKGEVESNHHKFSELDQRVSDSLNSLERRVVDLETKEKTPIKTSAINLYKEGKKKFDEKKYNEAVSNLKLLVESFPKSQLVIEAYYMMGEAYFELKDYETAILEFDIVRKKFPKSKFLVPSLYSEALCFEKIDSINEAKLLLKTIIEEYPKNKLAKKAKLDLKRLENLKQPKKP